mmetsp:Transcript_97340/g.314336  ORF Transcript_97340/g.314336 Transcript_97340/m.314336 type:complete len:214 (-) Transcript_97340:133-774(-)
MKWPQSAAGCTFLFVVAACAVERPRKLSLTPVADTPALVQISVARRAATGNRAERGATQEVAEANKTNSSFIPLPFPWVVGVFPVKVFPDKPWSPGLTREHLKPKPSRFWAPALDPLWSKEGRPANASDGLGSWTRDSGKYGYVGKCEHIKLADDCTNAKQQYNLDCLGWGGHHCLPMSGSKCSDIWDEAICGTSQTAFAMSCTWNQKGCSAL